MADIQGCTNPAASNYNPSANIDNGSCVYKNKIGSICYLFEDVALSQIVDKSYTLSWSIEGENWVFYHDYIPDFYFDTREKLFTLQNGGIWKHNKGPVGSYYDGIKSFFVDVVFNGADEMTLNSINWVTQVLDQIGNTEESTTFTHITIWNSYQCSGRIAMADFACNNPKPAPTTPPAKAPHGPAAAPADARFNAEDRAPPTLVLPLPVAWIRLPPTAEARPNP